jgi:hypothetical protein
MKDIYKPTPGWARRSPTMTVNELIAKLSEYPADMAVVAEWEGTFNQFNAHSFSVEIKDRFLEAVLVIDVESLG